jgi:hypothetical protein
MLTAAEELFCQCLEVKKMTQYAAYLEAYPHRAKCKRNTIDKRASELANNGKILGRRKELRKIQEDIIQQEATWTRDNAYQELKWLIDEAKKEVQAKGEFSGPCVSAITNGIKELNTIYSVGEKKENGGGVLEDILSAVRGISND